MPALVEAVKDRDGRSAAAFALWQINKHPVAVEALAKALEDHTAGADYTARDLLRSIGPEAKAAVPALIAALKDGQVQRRVDTALTLWQIDGHPAAVPVLVAALQDGRSPGYARVAAAKGLWAIREHAAVVPCLLEVLEDKNGLIRHAAAEALWQINRHPASVSTLVENIKDRDSWVSCAAARTLGRIGAEATVAAEALTAAATAWGEDKGTGDADAARVELKRFEGTWNLKWFEQGGEKTAVKDFKHPVEVLGFNASTTIKDGQFDMNFEGETSCYSITVEPGKTPKAVDRVVTSEGNSKGRTYRYLCELDSDTLRLC